MLRVMFRSDETTDRVHAEQARRVQDPQHEHMLLMPDDRIVVQHVVEIADV
jgi:hypothetical protein